MSPDGRWLGPAPDPMAWGGGAPAGPGAGGGLPPPEGPFGGFISRFGGPIGFNLYVQQLQQRGLSLAVPISSIGQTGGLITQEEYGQYLRALALGQSAGGTPPEREGASGAGAGRCHLKDPPVTVSSAVQRRIDAYEQDSRDEIAPLGTAGTYPQEVWNELWTLKFATSSGIRLARQLLWLVRGIKKGRTHSGDSRVRYRGKLVDLTDASFLAQSAELINDELPVHGEPLYGFYSQSKPIIVGSPFGIEETEAYVRKIAPAIEAKTPDCRPAKNLNGDAYQALSYLAIWLRLRGRPRLRIGSRTYDVVALHLRARGAGPGDLDRLAHSTQPLERGEVATTQDRIAARSRRSPRRPVFRPTRANQAIDTPSRLHEQARGADSPFLDEEFDSPFLPDEAQPLSPIDRGRTAERFAREVLARERDTAPDWMDPQWDTRIPDDFQPEIDVPLALHLESPAPSAGAGFRVHAAPDTAAADEYRAGMRRLLWIEELARRRAAQHGRALLEGYARSPYVTSVSSGVRTVLEGTRRGPAGGLLPSQAVSAKRCSCAE